MSFIWVNMLWLLLAVPLLVIIYFLLLRRRKKFSIRYSSLSLVKEAAGRGPGIRRHIPAILFLVGLTAMILALARPAALVTLPSQQSTVILTLDISGSMRADDLAPTRMEAAKSAARLFVEKQPSTVRIGVVSFSESASLVQAPTTNREEVLAAIDRLTHQRRTAVGSGILTSLDAIFEDRQAQADTSRENVLGREGEEPAFDPVAPGSYPHAVIVLLTDGESNRGPEPMEAAHEAMDRGVRVFTVGVGSPDGTILNVEGWSIRVRLDEETLKAVAEQTGGRYFKADSETDLRDIYERLSTQFVLEREETEITAGFTAFAALMLLIAGLLSMLWFNRVI